MDSLNKFRNYTDTSQETPRFVQNPPFKFRGKVAKLQSKTLVPLHIMKEN